MPKGSWTFTLCVDNVYPVLWKPRAWTNRLYKGAKLRSVRVVWLWFAVAAYRMDDMELVRDPHNWGES